MGISVVISISNKDNYLVKLVNDVSYVVENLFEKMTGDTRDVSQNVKLVVSDKVIRISDEKLSIHNKTLKQIVNDIKNWLEEYKLNGEICDCYWTVNKLLIEICELIDLLKDYSDSGEIILKLQQIKEKVNICSEYIEMIDEISVYCKKRNIDNLTVQSNCAIVAIMNELKSIFKSITSRIKLRAGVYMPVEKRIVLYARVLGDYESNKEVWFSTFAHEMFHAMHYTAAHRISLAGGAKNGSIIKESLASYFQREFCVYKSQDSGTAPKEREKYYRLADELRREWKQEDIYYWPYAGAKYLDNYIFMKAYRTSLMDIDRAYEVIIREKIRGLML